MNDFFTWQMDYIYFFYGLACLGLAVSCYVIMRRKSQALPWIWLALFGIFHNAHEWIEVIVRGPWNSRLFDTLHVLFMTVSFIFLVEFGRAGVRGISGKGPGRWIFFPLLSLSFLGGFAGLDGFDATARYSLGLAGGIWSSRALFLASGKIEKGAGRWLVVGSAGALLYALATGIGVPAAPFAPASFVNRDIFFQAVGVPIQLMRGIFLTVMAFSIWTSSQLLPRKTSAFTHARGTFLPPIILILMVIAGWGITEFAGNVARQEQLQEGRVTLTALQNYFSAEIKGARQSADDKASSNIVRAALIGGRDTDSDGVRLLFDCRGMHNPHSLSSYLIDNRGRIVAGCHHEGAASAEMSLQGRKYILKRAISGKTEGDYIFDAGLRDWSYYAYAGVKDTAGNLIGVVIVKRELEGIEETFRRYPYCFLIDPHGVVFISGREDMCLKSLWPLSEDVHKALVASGQFGAGPFKPLLSGEAADGKFVTFEGRRLLAARKFVDSPGWSLVLLTPAGHIAAYRFFAIFVVLAFCGTTVGFFTMLYFTRESAAQILASERRYRSLVDGSPNCVALFDEEGRCVTINKSGLDLIGCREEEIVGKRFDRFRKHDTGLGIDELLADVLKGNKHSFEAEGTRPDGKGLICDVVLNPVPDSDGQIRSIVGIFMDISERKEAEDELHRYYEHLEEMVWERTTELSEINKRLEQEIVERRMAEEELKKHRERLSELVKEQTADLMVANDFLQLQISERKRVEEEIKSSSRRIETIINSSSDFIVMKDRDFRFLVVNEQCAKFFNAPLQEIIGKTEFDFMSAEAAEECRRSDEEALAADAPVFSEERAGDRWLHIVKQKVFDAEGNVSGIVEVMRDITDRKKAEEDLRKYYDRLEEMVRVRTAELSEVNARLTQLNDALKNSEERFRSLFNLASDGILLIDAGGESHVIADANVAACAMNGYEPDELIGMPITALDDEESRNRFPDLMKQIMLGEAVTFEIRHVRKDGVIFPVEVSAQLIHLSGNPYILAVDRDITQRKKMEEKVMLFSKAVEETMDGVQITDLAGYIVYSNKAITEIYGYSPEELFGRHVNEMNVDPDYARKEILPSIRKAGRWNGELIVRHKGGREFPVWLTASIIKDAKGRPLAMVGAVRDVTDRKKAEEELKRHKEHLVEMVEERTVELKTAVQLLTSEINYRKMTEETLKESEAKFRKLSLEFNTLLDAMPDSLLLLSSDLRVMWANSATASMLGREPSALTGLRCFEMWYNRTEPCEDCFALRSFCTGNCENSQLTTPTGRLLDGRAFPIKGEEGTVNSVIIVLTDITEKTALQAEAMRASHLASLGELAAGVAHEINNPINGIINYAQILANKIAAGSKENEISQRIIREGDRIASIVRGLLSFARERKEERITVAVRKILGDTLTLTETQVRKDGIDLLINIPEGLPDIVANPQQIQQVFLNVISNARFALNQKYPGTHIEKKFVISAERTLIDNAPFVRVTFYDMGIGIPADIIEKVMHPFFSTKPSGLGTGLGLSISHGIIRSHGGRLAVESVEGAHTKVTIDLPAKERNGE